MNITIKKSIYLTVMMGIVFTDCYAGEGKQQTNVRPNGQEQTKVSQSPLSLVPITQVQPQLQQQNVGTTNKDILGSCTHSCTDSIYACRSILKNISKDYIRDATRSTLFFLKCGNTYKGEYRENNVDTTIFEMSLFNTYEKSKVINNTHSSRFVLSIGDIGSNEEENSKEMDNVAHASIFISMKSIAALCATAVLFKYASANALLTALGITISKMFVLPAMLAGSLFCPVLVIMGSSMASVICFASTALLTKTVTMSGFLLMPMMSFLFILGDQDGHDE